MDIALLNRVLRAPADVAEDCREDRDVKAIAANSIAAIVIGAVLFGAAVGSWHDGLQAVLASVKLPLVTIGTLALCVPAFYAIAAVFGRAWSLRAVVSIMLVAGARFSLVLLASAPVLWLTINLGGSYHLVKLTAALAYALGGLAALVLLLRGLGDGPGKKITVAMFVGVFLLVGGQTAWILRPYIGNPDHSAVTAFTKEREGGLVYQLFVSLHELFVGADTSAPSQ